MLPSSLFPAALPLIVSPGLSVCSIKCVDTNFNPPKTIMSNSVYEIAHCGVDVSKPVVEHAAAAGEEEEGEKEDDAETKK